jgi:hypothetical protein
VHRVRLTWGVLYSTIACALVVSAPSCQSIDVDRILDEASDLAGSMAGTAQDGSEEQAELGAASRPARPRGSLSTGPTIFVASQVIEPAGGAVTVRRPGDPLDGLVLDVPQGSYPNPQQVTVSHSPVNSHTFGEYFTPATPLISIENGGDYSEKLITLSIPVDIPADHFAMAFYYDDVAGSLEGIPFSGMDDHSITVVTRHFSGIIVSVISNTVLDDLMKADIDSHFRPGIDDWQFTNFGSYIAPGGHCAGQCLSALWYFCEQPDGKDLTLNGRYDKNGKQPVTPNLWEDDSHGYRLASTVQKDINWNSFENELMTNLAGKDDELTYKAFAYAIQLTGEPQEVGIFSSAGGGHDMICYRVHNNSLYIADPNYPGNTERRIEFVNGHFKPYNSGANAAEIAAGNGKAYETIEYCAKSATVNWTTIAARWNEFKASTIGNDRFPQYNVVVIHDDAKEEALVDGYKSEQKKIKIAVRGNIPMGIRVYRNGNRLDWDANGKYELEDGDNEIGIAIYGDVNDNAQNRNYRYVDFQYLNVQYGESECRGWVLDSVVQKEFVAFESDEYRHNFSFDASSDGWYSSSGRHVVSKYDGTDFNDVFVDFAHSGSWTSPPDCLKPNEPVRIEMNCSSSYTTSEPVDWGIMASHLILSWNNSEIGRINHEMYTTDAPQESTMTAEFVPWEGSPGEYWPPLEVWVGTDSGTAKYEYHYVWQE